MFYLKLFLSSIFAMVLWVTIAFAGALFGWWMQPLVPNGELQAFHAVATDRLAAENKGNSALVLIQKGKVAGEHYSDQADKINRDTMFSTASMSKWLTAYGVMKLIDEGRIDLDRPASEYLTRWSLPESEFDHQAVTVRRLLSHTAGLGDGLGFGDYLADEQIPSLEASLSNPRGSSTENVKISVVAEPGSEFIYSGGSYLLLELIVEEVTGLTFADYMREAVFEPLGMTRSGYSFISHYENNAGSFDREGKRAITYQYASRAATGFSTSTADLQKFVLSQLPGAAASGLLPADALKDMRSVHGRTFGFDMWGLGTILYSPTASGDDFVFGHDGANDPAINTAARLNPETGDAIIVLVTGHPSLATNIASDWVFWQTGYPDILDTNRTIASAYVPILAGVGVIFLCALVIGFRHRKRGAVEP